MTDGQKRAAEAMFDAWPNNAWPRDSNDVYGDMSPKAKSYLVAVVEAVAPLVQEPWELPTQSEVKRAYYDFNQHELCGIKLMLYDFVEQRNAALLPKVDERRDQIAEALCAYALNTNSVTDYYGQADAILAALDKEAK